MRAFYALVSRTVAYGTSPLHRRSMPESAACQFEIVQQQHTLTVHSGTTVRNLPDKHLHGTETSTAVHMQWGAVQIARFVHWSIRSLH